MGKVVSLGMRPLSFFSPNDVLNELIPPQALWEYEQLKKDLKKDGFSPAYPILTQEHGQIIDGHHRVRAATELEIKEIPCIVYDDNDMEAISRGMRLNFANRTYTDEQRNESIVKLRKMGWTQEEVAKRLNCSQARVSYQEKLASLLRVDKVGGLDRRTKLGKKKKEEIKERFSRGNITQRQLAADYGVSQGAISNIINPPPEPVKPIGKRVKYAKGGIVDLSLHQAVIRIRNAIFSECVRINVWLSPESKWKLGYRISDYPKWDKISEKAQALTQLIYELFLWVANDILPKPSLDPIAGLWLYRHKMDQSILFFYWSNCVLRNFRAGIKVDGYKCADFYKCGFAGSCKSLVKIFESLPDSVDLEEWLRCCGQRRLLYNNPPCEGCPKLKQCQLLGGKKGKHGKKDEPGLFKSMIAKG